MMNTVFACHDANSSIYSLTSKYRATLKNIFYGCLEFFNAILNNATSSSIFFYVIFT